VKSVAMTDKPDQSFDDAEADLVDEAPPAKAAQRRVSLSLQALLFGALMVALISGLALTTWLYLGERSQVQATAAAAADRQKAEQIALDYAVNAAAMNFQDLNTWKGKLVNGTSPELKDKLSKAANSMEQLLVPLQWTSTAEPLAAKVRSDTNGVYVVDTFVSVLTKTTQAPDNLQSTATYSITIDANHDWAITDVGGIGAVVGGK
jgi:Mce-associated membrane protein